MGAGVPAVDGALLPLLMHKQAACAQRARLPALTNLHTRQAPCVLPCQTTCQSVPTPWAFQPPADGALRLHRPPAAQRLHIQVLGIG